MSDSIPDLRISINELRKSIEKSSFDPKVFNKSIDKLQKTVEAVVPERAAARQRVATLENTLKTNKKTAAQLRTIGDDIRSLKTTAGKIVEGVKKPGDALSSISKSLKEQIADRRKSALSSVANIRREQITGPLKDLGKGVANAVSKALGGLNLGTLLKGLGLFTLLKNPELFANAIKSIAEGAVKLAETINSQAFKDGMAAIVDGLTAIAKFGIDRLVQFLDGIAGVSKGLKDLMDGKFWEIDWKDLAGDIGNVAAGLAGLALILAPKAALMIALKALTVSVKGVTAVLTGTAGLTAAAAAAGLGLFALGAKLHDWLPPGMSETASRRAVDSRVDEVGIKQAYNELKQETANSNWFDNITGAAQQREMEIKRLEALAAAQGIQLQKGSLVPGSGDGDKVPALLEPGEYVLNKKLVSAMGVNNLNQMNFGAIPRFQQGGHVVEYITGDRSHGGYREDHGGANYHEHVAFESVQQRDAAIRALQSAGIIIGSTYRPGDPGYHGVDQALDVPLGQNLINGYTDDRAGEEKFSADVRRVLASAGFSGSGIAASPTALPNTYTVAGVTYDVATGASINPQTGQPQTQAFSVPTTPNNQPISPLSLPSGLGHFAKMFDVLKGVAGMFGLSALLPGSAASAATSPTTPMTSLTPLSGSAAASAKEMYSYIKSKGYTSAQAKGLVANIQRESSFRTDAVGDNGSSFGLFQWNRQAGRSGPMMAALPNWRSNWKGQIDYALGEFVGPQYRSATQGMSAHSAADWWMRNWERPSDIAGGSRKHAQMLSSYQFKHGGLVPSRNSNAQGGGQSMRTTPSHFNSEYQQLSRSSRAMGLYDLQGNSKPVVVPIPVPSGGGATGGATTGTSNVPTLPATHNSIVAADYLMRVNLGVLLST